ncbi:hypothetical protein BCR36DRAFT_278203 [Piromyces finnis]|uniref:Uncharacterized protein n=1 Tax=Piromyces finnis TaxID=1754191 RepID=A0A1Y1VJ19_9FUNG|nr:hypothetical protein BCR36DRAFT_278203 [Piromyces finnis]|eukprot:ORX57720.1 hypothetical protein BCR36DRAFT_278203 [Piromyces finnis]
MIIQNIILIYILLFILYNVSSTLTKNIYVYNNSTYFENLGENVTKDLLISNEDINIYFVDECYDLTILYNFDFNIERNVKFIGMNKNGTIFDYKNTNKGIFHIEFDSNCINTGCNFSFENIIFQNYNHNGNTLLSIFQIISESMNFILKFQNCIFRNNKSIILKYLRYYDCNPNISLDKQPSIIVKKCQF